MPECHIVFPSVLIDRIRATDELEDEKYNKQQSSRLLVRSLEPKRRMRHAVPEQGHRFENGEPLTSFLIFKPECAERQKLKP